jgi:hypothetical protein
MLRAMYEYGERLPVDSTMPLQGKHFRFELSSCETMESEEPSVLFRDNPRTSDFTPYTLRDQVRFVMGGSEDDPLFKDFWAKALAALEGAQDSEILVAAKAAVGRRGSWPLPAINDKNVKRPCLLTWQGQPLTERPSVREWWDRKYKQGIAGTEKPTSVCILTGEPCAPLRNHPKFTVEGTGNKVPLLAFKQPTFRYYGQMEGDNFPVSPRAGASYARGFETLLNDEHSCTVVTPHSRSAAFPCTLLLWPNEGLSHPLIPLAIKVMHGWPKKEEAVEMWAAIEALPAEDNARLHAAFLRGSSGRIAVLRYEVLTAATLRKNLLRFHTETPRCVSFPQMAHAKNGAGGPTILYPYHVALLAMALILGEPYPRVLERVLPNYLNEETQETILFWLTAIRGRSAS